MEGDTLLPVPGMTMAIVACDRKAMLVSMPGVVVLVLSLPSQNTTSN